MDVEEVIKAVTRQFGDETGAQIDASDVLRWINEGQFQIARRIGDVVDTTTIPLVIGTFKYLLPTNFFKIISAEIDGARIQLVTPAQLSVLYPDLNSSSAQSGVSKFFSIEKISTNQARVTLAPVCGVAGSLVIVYKNRPPIINSTEDTLSIPDEYHTTLVTYCLAKAKQLDGDTESFVALTATFNTEVQEDSHDSKHKDEETYPYIRTSMGDW